MSAILKNVQASPASICWIGDHAVGVLSSVESVEGYDEARSHRKYMHCADRVHDIMYLAKWLV